MSRQARDPERSEPVPRAKDKQIQPDDAAMMPLLASSGQPSAVSGQPSKWQEFIWREWRTCPDETYAEHLFNLVSETALGWGSNLTLALSGTLYGLLVGYWLGLISLNWQVRAGEWQLIGLIPLMLAWLVGMIGGIGGVGISQRLSWRVWLGLLTPNVFANKLGGLGTSSLILFIGLVAGLGNLGLFLGAVWGALLGLISGTRRIIGIGALVGAVSGLVGHTAGQGTWLGLGMSLAIGVWLGVSGGSGPLGLLIGYLGLLVGLALFGSGNWVVIGLGLIAGFGLGIGPNMLGRGLEAAEAYNYRSWYFWWRGQPLVTNVERALQVMAKSRPDAGAIWAEPLRRLEQHKQQPPGHAGPLIEALQSSDWVDRFVARQALVVLGGRAVGALRPIAVNVSNPLQQTALWLLARIEQETTNRLAWRRSELLCPHCLARFGAHIVSLEWGVFFTYYGCRLCGQSREFVEWLKVVAVLDSQWADLYLRQEEHLRLNWLKRRSLFDFDEVEIVQASDEEVERFAVQVGNDTDPFRQPRYAGMRCVIAPECRLSENTLRILGSRFGRIESGES